MGHNDHLKEPGIEKRRGLAKGIYYGGIALTGADFILIAPNMRKLREYWATFSEAPVNESECVHVGLFQARDIRDLPAEAKE